MARNYISMSRCIKIWVSETSGRMEADLAEF